MNGNYAYWKVVLWRWLRGAVHTSIAETIVFACGTGTFDIIKCYSSVIAQWGNPRNAGIMIALSFIAGMLMAAGMSLRDYLSRGDKNSLWNKLPL